MRDMPPLVHRVPGKSPSDNVANPSFVDLSHGEDSHVPCYLGVLLILSRSAGVAEMICGKTGEKIQSLRRGRKFRRAAKASLLRIETLLEVFENRSGEEAGVDVALGRNLQILVSTMY